MKTYEPKAYSLAYSDGRGNYSILVVIAESAEQAAAYYTIKQGVRVINCTETDWPEPEQPRGYVPLDWVAPAAEPEPETAETAETTTETVETTPAAELETEAETEITERATEVNPMCTDCTRRGTDCDGTTCMAWTGCVNRKTAYRSAAELAAARRARGWAVCKRDLLALAGGGCKPLRWVCIRYKLSFYGLDPYCMGAELMAGGVRIVYDDTAISPADNRAEQRRVQRAYMAREGARA